MVEQLQHFKNFYGSHGSTARLLEGGENIILILQIIHCCFQRQNNCKNRLTVDEVIAKKSDTTFLYSVYSTV